MEQNPQNRADGRDGDPNYSGDHPTTARNSETGASSATGSRVRYCAWCCCVTIYPGDDIPLILTITERRRSSPDLIPFATTTKGRVLAQDGICEACRAEKFPETVRPK